jgi:hypothetical protein
LTYEGGFGRETDLLVEEEESHPRSPLYGGLGALARATRATLRGSRPPLWWSKPSAISRYAIAGLSVAIAVVAVRLVVIFPCSVTPARPPGS